MNRIAKQLLLFFLFAFSCSMTSGQSANVLMKRIIGTWVLENKNDKFVFKSNGDCFEYFVSATPVKYKYRISNDPAMCDPEKKKSVGDTTAYLILRDIKEKSEDCFIINQISNKQLSISPWGGSGGLLYFKDQKVKH